MQTNRSGNSRCTKIARATLRCLASLCVSLALSGCTLSPLAKRTASFSVAATATTQDAANAYQIVEQAHAKMQAEALVLTFDKKGFDQKSVTPFLKDADVEARTNVLNGIKQYAELLAEVSSDKPLAALDTQAKALGTAIQSISSDDFKSAGISSTEIDAGVAGLRELGQLLINRDRDKKLPKILAEMDPHIQSICALLQAEIGTPHSRGLRNELATSFDGQIQYEVAYIKENKDTLSPLDKRVEIENLPALVLSAQKADQVLAATSEALGQLAKTHHALATTVGEEDSASFKVHLSELIQDGQNIGTFYNSLQSK